MTQDDQKMIRQALEAHAERIRDVREATAEAAKMTRENQLAIARIEERMAPLERGIVDIRDSVRSLTDAIEAGDPRLLMGEQGIRIEQLRTEFHDCRRLARRRLSWVLGVVGAAAVGAAAYFGRLLVELAANSR